MQDIVNKVAESGLLNINLEDFLPKEKIVPFDLKEFLFMELILKEKDYREALKSKDYSAYNNAIVAIYCSADAIIPMWANMLATTYLQPVAKQVKFGTVEQIKTALVLENIQQFSVLAFADKRVVVKGCGEVPMSESAYIAITEKLIPVAKSIMYGEPCSTVPIFKKKVV